jgi:hypothetical protein
MVLISVLCSHCQSDQVIKGVKPSPANNATSVKTQTVPASRFSSISSIKVVHLRSKSKLST